MKIEIKNLGILKQAEFSLGNLTIICGANNTGKTYATYALFGFLEFWREAFSVSIPKNVVEELLEDGTTSIRLSEYVERSRKILSRGCEQFTTLLPRVFAAPEERFEETDFSVKLDAKDLQPISEYKQVMGAAKTQLFEISKEKSSDLLVITLLVKKDSVKIPLDIIQRIIGEAVRDVLFGHLFPKPFIASAERTGAAIFRKELNFSRNRILEKVSKTDKAINPLELLMESYEDYALPVKSNVDFTRNLEKIKNRKSFIAEKHSEVLSNFADIIGGKFKVTKDDDLQFLPKRAGGVKLSMDESSSAVRSLLDIGFYLRHVAEKGDLLIVDEPELNLHPENQCRIARLFAQIVNLGIKVFITTHSDYIIKELSTLIMLNSDRSYLGEIKDQYGYQDRELLSPSDVKLYIARPELILLEGNKKRTKCPTLTEAKINSDFGIEVPSFDETIERMNKIHEDIIWGGE